MSKLFLCGEHVTTHDTPSSRLSYEPGSWRSLSYLRPSRPHDHQVWKFTDGDNICRVTAINS